MNFDRIIIDGYSLLYRAGPPPSRSEKASFALARDALVRRLERLAGRLAVKITIVFDGRGERLAPGDLPSGPIEVLFSAGSQTADTVIERIVAADADPSRITVVTSDRRERETVEAAGARTISCGDFLALCDDAEREMPRLARRTSVPPTTLGDLFPGQ